MSEELNNQDVNQEVETSSTSSATENSSQTSDASTQQDDNNQEPSLQDVVQDVLKKHGIEDKTSETKEEAKESGSKLEQDKGKKEEVKTEETPSKTPQTDEEKELANYPQRAQERIRGLISERKTLTEQIEREYKPTVQRMQNIEQFCTKSNINAEDFHLALELTAAMKTNPQEGIKRLEEYLTNARQQVGLSLPPDLQQRVDDGKLSLEDAKEWAKSRIEAQGRKTQLETTVKQTQAQTQQQLVSSIESWKTTKTTSDPDFKPKKEANSPDGKFELTMLKFNQLWTTVPVYTVAEAVALLDRAYNEVSGSIKSFLPTPPRRRQVSSLKSSNGEHEETIDTSKPGWARKVVQQTLGRR